jgi:hypothetical protein
VKQFLSYLYSGGNNCKIMKALHKLWICDELFVSKSGMFREEIRFEDAWKLKC